ncbi:MAG: dockerin type I repeat-containing protein [Ruminococcus sp.]|nr:dockerin type I repeat-containing protein [Ruminococcus sp.]
MGVGLNGTDLYWTRYPGENKYSIYLQRDLAGSVYLTQADVTYSVGQHSYQKAVNHMDIGSLLKQVVTGDYRVQIVAYNYAGEQISEPGYTHTFHHITRYRGDVNRDGAVDLSDYSDLAKYFAEWTDYDVMKDKEAADLNKSGGVDLDDLSILAKCFSEWDGCYEKYITTI